MTIYLKQNTASQEIALGFFVDSTDGNTEETGLTIAAADIRLHKAGGTTLTTPAAGATHISNGIYYWVADATDTGTLGPLVIYCHPAGALAVRVECCVLAANVYDSLIGGGDLLQVDTTQLSGDTTAADNAESFFDGTGYAGTNNVIPNVTLVGTLTTYTGNTPQTGDTYALANGASGFVATKAQTAAIEVDTQDIQARLPATLTGAGNMKVDVLAIDGSTNAAANLERGTLGTALGTVGAASTTTSIVTSSLDPAAATIDQFKGRIVTFDRATTTANLRGQATDITGSSAAGVLTVTALTDAPVSGDTFVIT